MKAPIVLACVTLYHQLQVLLQKVVDPKKTKRNTNNHLLRRICHPDDAESNMETPEGSLSHHVDLRVLFQVTIIAEALACTITFMTGFTTRVQ